MTRRRLLVFALLAAGVAAYFAGGGPDALGFAEVKAKAQAARAWYEANRLQAAGGYFALYVLVAGLSLPGAAALTLAGGAIFGLFWGTLLVSFASSIGATLAFLASRFLLRDWVQARFAAPLRAVNDGISRDGAFYLFALRMIPAVPFFAINLAMGLTTMRAWTFYWVSQLGMLAGTVVYVNAGTQLAAIDSPAAVFSPGLIGAFLLLGLFPLAARKTLEALRARRVYARWAHRRPRRFERNLVVIGGGAAGLVAAYVAAAARAKVTLVERHRMGGDCLHTGCVPSKALLRSARLVADIRRHRDFGLRAASVEVDFGELMDRVARVVRALEPHDSVARYTALGVECLAGEARLVTPWEVEVRQPDGARRRLTTRAIVLATGARPVVPPIPGIERTGYVTSDTLWSLRRLPRRVLVLGAGPLGCELAQALARLGAEVTLIERLGRVLAREDPEVSALLAERFAAEGIAVLVGCEPKAFRVEAGEKVLLAERAGTELRVPFDLLVCALGRAAHTADLGLEDLGIALAPAGTVQTDAYLRTNYPNIYACGDVAGPLQFTHAASHQAATAALNALFGPWYRRRADRAAIPWTTFTDPEVARVGLNETEARQSGVPCEVTRYDLAALDRAIADEAAQGFVKVLTAPGTDRILGATVVGAHAGETIAEIALAIERRIGLARLLGTVHVYPTYAEAVRHAAGAWRRARITRGAQAFLAALNDWRRGAGSARAVLARLLAAAADRRPAAPPGGA